MTIQERAIEAWHQHIKDVEAEQRELTAKELERRKQATKEVATRFEVWYGEAADKVEGSKYFDCADIYHNGLHLAGYVDDPNEFYLVLFGTCPECGEETESDTFTTLWELGRLLEEGFQVAEYHECEEEE
jgi:uncharacterized protein YggL (DUF469 family)